jgi:sulfite exporter TauE/SafE
MNGAELGAPLLLGLFGAAHCAVMCGGIAVAARDGRRHLLPRAGLAVVLSQNAGRVASYAAAGAIAGTIGSAALHAAPFARAEMALEAFAAAALLVTGLSLAGVLKRNSRSRLGSALWAKLAPAARRLMPARSLAEATLFGALWGWMPCGLVYSALILAAATGSVAAGAATMVLFGLGTVPTLVGLAVFARSFTRAAWTPYVRPIAGVVLVASGFVHALHVHERVANASRVPTCCHHGQAANVPTP